MKKSILLFSFIAFTLNAFAFCTQSHWRWRKDDGSETTATWLANQDETPTITSGSDAIRLRIELFNPSTTGGSDLATSTIQYKVSGASSWNNITTTEGTNAFVLVSSSPFVTDGTLTTRQLTGTTGYTYEPGKIITSANALTADVVAAFGITEYEWVIKPTSKITPNTKYLFNIDPQDTTKTIPRPALITAATLPVRLVNFTAKAESNKVKLQWTTEAEQNNDHFSIERSIDGKSNWQSVTTVKGNGTTATALNYSAYDEAPIKGNNYYRIKQFDADGNWQISEIKSINILLVKTVLNVFPNPVKDKINFTLSNYSGNVRVLLTNTNGVKIHEELKNITGGVINYSLELNNRPKPGIYYLQIIADDLMLKSKVIVQ